MVCFLCERRHVVPSLLAQQSSHEFMAAPQYCFCRVPRVCGQALIALGTGGFWLMRDEIPCLPPHTPSQAAQSFRHTRLTPGICPHLRYPVILEYIFLLGYFLFEDLEHLVNLTLIAWLAKCCSSPIAACPGFASRTTYPCRL